VTTEYPQAQHVTTSYTPHVILTGVSFRTLDVDGREKLVKRTEDPTRLAAQIVENGLATEAAVISTCNRFEIVTVGGEPGGGVRTFFENLLDLSQRDSLYQYVDSSAVKHLYRVSSSLDSMVLGEVQILGQVKDAYKRAVVSGSVGSHLHHLFQSAFHVAKKVKAHTEISHHGVSVSYVAVRLAQQIFQDLADTRVLVVGSGEMAELAALHLCSHGCKKIVVANRTVERAAELAERFGGAAVALGDVESMLDQVDIVIGSIKIDRAIISQQSVLKRKVDSPLFLIDLGLPRNFANDVAEVDNVYLYNLDDLASVADQNKSLREAAAKEAEIVIDYGLLQFDRWRKKLLLQPELLSLRGRVDHICRTEIEKIFNRAGMEGIPIELQRHLVHSISQKLSHDLSDVVAKYLGDDSEREDSFPFLIVPEEE
jgi:glutamyl-tRNA reductase